MIRILCAFLFCLIAASAEAQVFSAITVTSCGAQSLTAGQYAPVTMDLTGKICEQGGGGGGGSVTQGTSPWVDNVTQWASGVLGAMANYGTSPGAVLVPGVNAFITNTPAVTQSGVWAVTPTLTTVSTLSLTSTTTAYTAGQLVANNATAGSITNPSFSMPTLGGAIPRLRLQTTDTTSTAWASASVQIDLWSASPTWTSGDHGTWLPATGAASHIASYTCSFPSVVWGDGLATECSINQGNYASVTATTVYWSVEATSGSGVLGGSGKALKLTAELN